MFKNVAAKFMVFAFDATTNVPKTGDAANITAYVSKDYGTVTVLGDTSATEMDATNAPGYYLFDAAQGETNADILLVSGKSSTANIKVIGAPSAIYTRPTTGWLAPTVAGRTLVVDAAGLADANAVKLGPTGSGTALTARDIGLSVLLSSGTGTGQLSFTSGILKVDVDTIKTNPVVNGGTFTFPTNATGASTTNITAGTITTVTTVTTLTTYTGNTPQTGDNFARIGAAGAGLTALGDTRVANLDATVSSRLASASYTAPPSAASVASAVLTTQMTESYATVHVAPTLAQAIFEVRGLLAEASVASTTLTVKKIDGSTTAETLTINSATAPTSITRTT